MLVNIILLVGSIITSIGIVGLLMPLYVQLLKYDGSRFFDLWNYHALHFIVAGVCIFVSFFFYKILFLRFLAEDKRKAFIARERRLRNLDPL